MFENYNDVLNQLLSAGLLVSHLEVDSHRMKRVGVNPDLCPVDREKQKSAGWYKLNSFTVGGKNYIVGSYGWWKAGDNNAQKIEWDKTVEITPEDRQAIAARHKQAQKEAEASRQREADKAAARAQNAWRVYQAEGHCDYLTKKQVKGFGVRFDHKGAGTMAVPMMNVKGQLQGLQIIRGSNAPAGKPAKQYWPKGLSKIGHFHLIGMPVDVCLVAEGYATAASIHEATGLPIAVAFDAGNLKPVCEAIQKHYPKTKIVVCADDDYLTEGNPGITKAQQAALTVGGAWVKPDFIVAGQDIRASKKLTDFNDLHVHPEGGLHLVSAQIAEAVKSVGIRQKSATSAKPAQTGEGVKRPDPVSIMSVDDIVDRFVYVDDVHGDHVFDSWTKEVVKIKKVQGLLPHKSRFDEVKAHPLWVGRAVYRDQIGFDPTGKDTNIKCNRWSGWPTTPNHNATEKDCEKLLGLLKNLCSSETNPVVGEMPIYEWVLKWLAYPIQHPGAKMDTALVVHGPQGTGKNLFFGAYGEVFGEHFSLITQDTMEDQFNSDWVDRKLFVLADEIVAMQERTHVKNKLKTMITGDTIRVNQKMIAAYPEKNFFNMVFLSNELNPVVLEKRDRRHLVLWTPDKSEKEYYTAVKDEIDHGGVKALHQYLLNIDLTGFTPNSHPPMTFAKQNLILLNADTPHVFFHAWKTGDLNFNGYSPEFMPYPDKYLYRLYLEWCNDQGERWPKTKRQFVASLGSDQVKVTKENVFRDCFVNDAGIFNFSGPNTRIQFLVPALDDVKEAITIRSANDPEHIECFHPVIEEQRGSNKRETFSLFYHMVRDWVRENRHWEGEK